MDILASDNVYKNETHEGRMDYFLINRTYKSVVVGLSLIATSSLSPAMAQKPRQSIELTRLISMYMLPSDASYNVFDWSTGSEPGTPINWLHGGIKECERFALGTGVERPYCRTGNVVVTVAGKPTYTVLNRVIEPGKWKVTLGGGRIGVNYIVMDADTLSRELDSHILVTAATNVKSAIQLRQISKCGSEQWGGPITFSISAPGKKDAVIREWWSCGSGGCSVILTLVPNRENASELTRCDS